MARPLKVVHVGLGPIGQGIARLVAETDGLQIVGATDPFPDHAGKDLGALLGLPRRLRVKVEGNPERFFRRAREISATTLIRRPHLGYPRFLSPQRRCNAVATLPENSRHNLFRIKRIKTLKYFCSSSNCALWN